MNYCKDCAHWHLIKTDGVTGRFDLSDYKLDYKFQLEDACRHFQFCGTIRPIRPLVKLPSYLTLRYRMSLNLEDAVEVVRNAQNN